MYYEECFKAKRYKQWRNSHICKLNYVGTAGGMETEGTKRVASNKDNDFHFAHCRTGPDSWCKFNSDKANKTNTYKPGQRLPNDVKYKIRPTYLELSKESELVKCLHGKTQNTNESFNGMIWGRIPKDTFVSLPCLQFGVYDAVSNFNIGMKASVLTYEN